MHSHFNRVEGVQFELSPEELARFEKLLGQQSYFNSSYIPSYGRSFDPGEPDSIDWNNWGASTDCPVRVTHDLSQAISDLGERLVATLKGEVQVRGQFSFTARKSGSHDFLKAAYPHRDLIGGRFYHIAFGNPAWRLVAYEGEFSARSWNDIDLLGGEESFFELGEFVGLNGLTVHGNQKKPDVEDDGSWRFFYGII